MSSCALWRRAECSLALSSTNIGSTSLRKNMTTKWQLINNHAANKKYQWPMYLEGNINQTDMEAAPTPSCLSFGATVHQLRAIAATAHSHLPECHDMSPPRSNVQMKATISTTSGTPTVITVDQCICVAELWGIRPEVDR